MRPDRRRRRTRRLLGRGAAGGLGGERRAPRRHGPRRRRPPAPRLPGTRDGSTSAIDLPRWRATSSGRRSFARPSTVAFAMLIGFVVPRLFASTSRIPASSRTARTPPPAMTPVPSLAGRSTTRAASNTPCDLVGDRRAVPRHGEEVLLGVVDGLGDRERNLARLAVADADAIDLVADHDERGEREPPSALDDLGDAVDLDDPLLELAGLGDFDVLKTGVLPRGRRLRAPSRVRGRGSRRGRTRRSRCRLPWRPRRGACRPPAPGRPCCP